VYGPAFVGWIGGSPGFSFSVDIGGGGGIGWFPLGPRDVFMPTYHVSGAYMTRINVTNTVVDRTTVLDVYHNNARTVTYANLHVDGAVTVVPHDLFVIGASVSRNVVSVPERDLVAAPVNRAGPAAEPTRASVVGEARPAPARPPVTVASHATVAVHTPARPQSFHANGAATEGRTAPAPSQPQTGGYSQGAPPSAPAYRPPSEQGGGEAAPPQNAPSRDDERSDENQPPAQTRTPNVRPAPPVRQPTPEEQQSDSAKEQGWQTKHQQVHQNDKPSGNSGSKPSKPPHS
jgi:hypothetical protein